MAFFNSWMFSKDPDVKRVKREKRLLGFPWLERYRHPHPQPWMEGIAKKSIRNLLW